MINMHRLQNQLRLAKKKERDRILKIIDEWFKGLNPPYFPDDLEILKEKINDTGLCKHGRLNPSTK